ncbi:MAG: nuclear transport factor 2 family protein [Dongiaceae bacterium]
MRAMKCLGLLLSVGLLAACAKPGPEAPAVDLAAEAQAIRDRSAEWLKLAQARDIAGIVNTILTADAVTLSDGNIRKGSAEIQSGVEAEMAAMPAATISWNSDDVKVAASGDLAYERGSFSFDPDGAGEKAADNGEFVTVWSKVDGTWRAVVDAGTARKPAEEAAAPAA